MLSNTADTKPSMRATVQEASGNASTGIRDAAVTSDNRNTDPLNASGSNSQSGLRSGTEINSATKTATPMNGNRSADPGKRMLTTILVTMAETRIRATIPTRGQSTCVC